MDAMRKLFLVGMLALGGCVSAQSNLARLQTECALAPLAQIGGSFIPVPGAGGVINLTISAVCANTALIANDEAAIAVAIEAIVKRKRN
jgi:hypothetical protein